MDVSCPRLADVKYLMLAQFTFNVGKRKREIKKETISRGRNTHTQTNHDEFHRHGCRVATVVCVLCQTWAREGKFDRFLFRSFLFLLFGLTFDRPSSGTSFPFLMGFSQNWIEKKSKCSLSIPAFFPVPAPLSLCCCNVVQNSETGAANNSSFTVCVCVCVIKGKWRNNFPFFLLFLLEIYISESEFNCECRQEHFCSCYRRENE